ncbi:FAD-dependent monooxygenase [Micromonospora sp. NPDC005215]|uniref:FAD-dependent monooxygenase n=1 Tax=Micromonospora sp. NPDC005215 TaxID=3157024 RepID=UPI0033BE75CE
MSRSKPRVAVVGAGIGGLAAGIALSRHGIAVDIYEQAAELREVGLGLHLGPNASRILHRWGMADALRATAVRPEALEARDHRDGRTLAQQPMGAAWEDMFGAPHYTIHRAALHAALARRVPRRSIHLGRRLCDLRDEGDVLILTFDDGTTARADVLVGADGVHSVVRSTVSPPTPPVNSGNAAYRGLVAGVDLPRDRILVWVGPSARLICYPIDGGRRLTVVAVVPDTDVGSGSATGGLPEITDTFAGWHRDVGAIVDALGQPRRWALHDREPLDSWGGGRVTLLGDAAHPMLPYHGQEPSQAIEDAVAVAHCLAEETAGRPVTADRIATALARYEAIRRPHTARVQLESRRGGSLGMRPTATTDGEILPYLGEDADWIRRYDVEHELGALLPGTAARA